MRQITVVASTFAGIQLGHIIAHASKALYYMRIITIVRREDVRRVAYYYEANNTYMDKIIS